VAQPEFPQRPLGDDLHITYLACSQIVNNASSAPLQDHDRLPPGPVAPEAMYLPPSPSGHLLPRVG
jgi:hypothetical protein